MSGDAAPRGPWASVAEVLADLEHVAAAPTPDETLDRLCGVLEARGDFERVAAVRVLPTGPAFGAAGLPPAERARLRGAQPRVGPAERDRNRAWVLAHHRLAPGLDVCFVPCEARPAADWVHLASPAGSGAPGERWEAGDELLLVPHATDGASLGCVDLAAPRSGRRPTPRDAPRLAGLLAFARRALAGLDAVARAEERGREATRRVIAAMESLTSAGDMEELIQQVTETCTRLAGYRVGVLTVHLEDGPHLGHYNLAPGEVEAFLDSQRGTTVEGTAAKRRRIRELAFPGTSIAYVPHTVDLKRGQAFRPSRPDAGLHSWHEDDRLFLLMTGRDGRDCGVLSLDEPLDGHAPHPDALGSLRLAERFLALGTALIETRQAQVQLARSRRIEALGTLAAGVAHDFNNLVGVILGYASLLRLTTPDAVATARMAAQIEEACRRAAALTGRLRDFSPMRVLAREPVEPTALLEGVVERARARAARGVRVESDVAPDLPEIFGDATELARCLDQIATNALEAAPDGGLVRIEGRADEGAYRPGEPRRRSVRISVEDNGPGIPEDLRERVFEPFFSTRPRQEHEGLGLFVAFTIARAHGGLLEVGARPGGGTSVHLMLPVPLGEAASPAPGPAAGARPAGLPAPGGRARILVVEDEPAIQEVLRQALDLLGHGHEIVGDGEAALDALEAGADRFDVLLLDLVLPRRSGLEVFRRARALKPDLPVILSSGNVEEGLVHPELAAGLSAVLPKPWAVGDLERALDRVLRLRPRGRGGAARPSSPS